jgi:hypothetical protein
MLMSSWIWRNNSSANLCYIIWPWLLDPAQGSQYNYLVSFFMFFILILFFILIKFSAFQQIVVTSTTREVTSLEGRHLPYIFFFGWGDTVALYRFLDICKIFNCIGILFFLFHCLAYWLKVNHCCCCFRRLVQASSEVTEEHSSLACK